MEYRFHLPDFARHFKINIMMADHMKRAPETVAEGAVIGSVYGIFPNMIWNGGRFLQGQCDPRVIKEILTQFNRRGIPCRFTLTNPVLKKEHLSDPLCNSILKAADNGLNEAIVFSPMLEEHLRKNFPDMKLTSSTCKQIEDVGELEKELEKDYSLVVLDYNFNNDFEVLEKLPHREKAEILINPCCTPHCKRRGEHYRSIGRSQIKCAEYLVKNHRMCDPEPFECECMLKNLYQTTGSPLHISPDAVYGRYADMGYRNFKIEGRSVPDINVLENYMYYMIRPEYRDEVRLEMLLRLTKEVKYF
ncbi:MAG: hypothetical protein J6I96_05825 [Oscillospiraceae bacterium]|nr:hypothetical protein [Oscillospiraceae bacterium]